MPLKNGHITPQERAAVDAYARTGDKAYAGQVAGYKHPTAIHKVLARPQIHAEIVRVQMDILLQEGLPAAIAAHIEIITDKKTASGARVQAIKLLYDRILGDKGQQGDKEPSEMSRAELAEAYARVTQEHADAAKLVAAKVESLEPLEPADKGFFG